MCLRELKQKFKNKLNSAAQNKLFTTVSYAQSIDGCLSQQRGIASILSGKDSMTMTHMLRSMHQAILIGKDTLVSDNPVSNMCRRRTDNFETACM